MPVSQSRPQSQISTMRSFNKGLPFTGSFNNSRFVTAEGPFNPAMVIKWLPLKDMSLMQPKMADEYQDVVDNIKGGLRKGSLVSAMAMDDYGDEERQVYGMVHEIREERENKRVRIFVQDFNTQNLVEVHPESIYREPMPVSESYNTDFLSLLT